MNWRGPTDEGERPDLFRMLALATIILGMVIVIAGFLVWYFTGRQSSLIIGSGLVLATGGGLRGLLANLLDKLPEYIPPPEELPPDRQRKRRDQDR